MPPPPPTTQPSELTKIRAALHDARQLSSEPGHDALYELLDLLAAATHHDLVKVASLAQLADGTAAPGYPLAAMVINHAMLRDEFTVHQLNEHGLEEALIVAGLFSDFLRRLEQHLPDQTQERERSLIITHLQEAAFWAKRAIAEQPVNQKGG